MNFLNWALLGGLVPLVALPLIIHLLNRRQSRSVLFSSVRNLKVSIAQRSLLYRLRHWILFLLRTALLLLLLLAFLKPVLPHLGSAANATGRRRVLLMLDHSLSMEFAGEGVTPRQRAIAEAEKVLDTLEADDLVNVLAVDHGPAAAFVEFTRDHAEARRFLQTLGAGVSGADFSRANAEAARLLQAVAEPAEIFYFSDLQRKNWADVDFSMLPPAARLFFADVGTSRRNNRAVLEAVADQSRLLAGDTVMLEITVGNYGDEPMQDAVRVVVDEQAAFEQTIEVAPWSVGKIRLPVPAGAPGIHLCRVQIPADGLAADNQFHLTLPVLEKEEVLIVSEEAEDARGSVWFLKTALNPYEQQRGSLLPRHVPTGALSAAQLAATRKVFITRAGLLPDAAPKALAEFVFQGGGVVYFLDGETDAANLARLAEATGPDVLPLRLSTRREAANVGSAAQQVIRGNFRSPFLALFAGEARQDLSLLEFYDYYQAGATGAGEILLSYADESPAMAVADHGLGTILFLNFSASELSSNLARQRLFPAWIQELARQLSNQEPPATAHVIGETVVAEVWRSELEAGGLRSPAGREVTLQRELQGQRMNISFTPVEAGFYKLANERLLNAFAVNPDPGESDLRPIQRELLPEQVGGTRTTGFVAGREDYEHLVSGRPVFHWFVGLAMALLMVEAAFQLLVRRLEQAPAAQP